MADPHGAVVETRGEMRANVATHAAGALGAAALTAVLVVLAARGGPPRSVTTLAIFGGALITSMLGSAVYHAVSLDRLRARAALRRVDHAAIYVLIAGTYTPLMLVSLGGAWGWSMAGVSWGLALTGVAMTLLCFHRLPWLQLGLKLGMSWLVLVAAAPLLAALSTTGTAFLIAGGLFYTAGVAFYLWESLRFNHAIWHGFVLLGAACHSTVMFTDVLSK